MEEALPEAVRYGCADGDRHGGVRGLLQESYARWKEAQEHIDSEGSTFETDKGYRQQTPWVGIANTNQKLMLQAASEFGLTPSARSRIMAASGIKKDDVDEMEEILGGEG